MEDTVVKLVKQHVIDCLVYQYNLHCGVKEKLEKLKDALNKIEAVVEPAGGLDLESEKHKNLKAWMREIKVAAEEANDVLDEFEYLCLKHQDEVGEVGCLQPFIECPISFIRHGFFHFLYMYARRAIRATDRLQFILSTNPLEFFRSANPLERLSSIQIKMDGLATRAEVFLKLVTDAKADDRGEHHELVGRKQETSSTVVEPELVRKDKLEEIINKLLLVKKPVSDRGSTGAFVPVPVLGIIGHGGMGKTTLAQHVYARLKDHFEVPMWAYVSQQFDVPTITRRMIESADPKERLSSTESLEALQQKLKEIVKSKKFLLVLDDVWYENEKLEEEWKKLCSPLAVAGGKGSKILLTSRMPQVEGLPGALTPSISLEGLTPDECWSIIQASAFPDSEISEDLVKIGRQIAGRVCGSPLAAKAVGVILRKKLDSDYWSTILNSELSKLPGNDIMTVLRLSYQYLPPHLRQCFACCSLFPKGHDFDVDMLVGMWVAHGYIRDRLYGERTEEDTSSRYFNDLLSSGFFTHRMDDNGIERVVMHDLMNDLARIISKDEFLLIEHTLPQDGLIPETIRHLSVLSIDYLAELKNKKSILSNLKTFLFVHKGPYLLHGEHVREVLKLLRRVRVLDIRWVLTEVPDDIDGWVHLRYLNLSPDSLPEWLWRLYFLQVLMINTYPTTSSMEKLCNLDRLRYLGFYRYLTLSEIKGLKSLQVVGGFLHVESGRGSDIGNLKPLNELQGQLELDGLNYVESSDGAREADLCGKKRLQNLALKWDYSSTCSSDTDVAAEVLNGLQPPSSLKVLQITNYPGMACPNWMGDPSFKNLYYIRLEKLLQLECLPPLEQLPSLKTLILSDLPGIKKLSHKVFRSLKILSITHMEELEEWSALDWSGGLPCLEHLTITDCPKLRELPTLSPTVMRLEIYNVGISSLPEIYEKCVDQGIESSSRNNDVISSSSKLSYLQIAECGSLKSLGEGLLQNQHRLRHLEQVFILNCQQLMSIPDEGFRGLSLQILEIYNCPNLTWGSQNQDQYCGLLPPSLEQLKFSYSHLGDETLSGFLHGLNNLSELNIWQCPCLKLMPSREVLAYLTSLQELSIYNCPSLIPSALDDLQALPSLKMLEIRECPGLLLETSSISTADDGEGMSRASFSLALERLEIDDPLMLTKVPFLKSLASVQEVEIYNASGLISFYPELEEWLLQNDTSLRKLIIKKAWQLQTLPDLPKSLDELEIYDVNEEFMKRYKRDIGPDWDKIRHIKDIFFID